MGATSKQWVVENMDNGFDGLVYKEASIPQVGETEVLVKLQAASLNYRDLIIPKVRSLGPTTEHRPAK
jgi:NADPH:quinone reductase-like Zn-dependent oxidoreductase